MHVVWDWNGTLLDDLPVVLASVNAGVEPYRSSPVTLDDYRTHYTRPVRQFYDSLLGREITTEEWLDLDHRFHEAYRAQLEEALLAPGAREALERTAGSGMRQSLLSMYPHDDLVPLVAAAGIGHHFARVDGLQGPPGDRKASYLESHLRALSADPGETLVVGDTPDDAHAAAEVGADCVLIDSGSHHRPSLEATGVRVASGLIEAIAPYLAH
ncbi:MAG TPA: HAD family hydrolase [Acidimicrobiia bacterium]|jgi:phosphoglycolate phosphatase-like HAD superfamily hydrolase